MVTCFQQTDTSIRLIIRVSIFLSYDKLSSQKCQTLKQSTCVKHTQIGYQDVVFTHKGKCSIIGRPILPTPRQNRGKNHGARLPSEQTRHQYNYALFSFCSATTFTSALVSHGFSIAAKEAATTAISPSCSRSYILCNKLQISLLSLKQDQQQLWGSFPIFHQYL